MVVVGYAQRPQLAIGLWDKHSSDRLRPVTPMPERKRQFAEPLLYPIRLDLREVLPIDTRRALVRATLGVRMRQHILTIDLVVQSVEAVPGFCLRFRV